ncbi:MAG: dihydroneopterin aldolase [Deltaproteobacteria bacterium RBG_13_65_10]|nr:MAG: dihydroneopterin aldolase [Deltaproteobacteria bacterium RBG_13_65_10]
MRSRSGGVGSPAAAADRVFLEGLILPARIGVTAAERASPQDLEADVSIHADLSSAGASDRLEDTLNYAVIRREALRVAGSRTWSLLEALAEGVASALLSKFPRAEGVTVTIRKPRPPFMSGVGAGGVTLVRRRGGVPGG